MAHHANLNAGMRGQAKGAMQPPPAQAPPPQGKTRPVQTPTRSVATKPLPTFTGQQVVPSQQQQMCRCGKGTRLPGTDRCEICKDRCRCEKRQRLPGSEFCEDCLQRGVRSCKHTNCNRYAEASSNYCDLHSCPLCQSDKPSGELKCKKCAAGRVKVQCRRLNPNGHRCTASPEHISPYCRVHLCPSCGNEKASGEERCPACRERCVVCSGDVAPGQTLCGTCKGLSRTDIEARQLYISEQARRRLPMPNRFLFIWDFDRTITRYHISDNSSLPCSPESIQQNLVDAEFFKMCILHLNAHGHHTKIATWADGDRAQWVVSQYLAHIFGPNETRTVLHTEGIEAFQPQMHEMEPEGKNGHIRNLVRQINSQGALLHESRIFLFDDREENIRLAKAAGCQAVHCPEGFTRHVWRRFTEMCGKACLPEFLELNRIAAGLPEPPPTALSPAMQLSPPPPLLSTLQSSYTGGLVGSSGLALQNPTQPPPMGTMMPQFATHVGSFPLTAQVLPSAVPMAAVPHGIRF
eukprot:GGOE01054327.1.p1 GENE.GGOE01054327.1~~GGOE01054327.1.p1  ORF type:complete len:558 (+),score=96.67 GGOE01054327.1:113-1675(+)